MLVMFIGLSARVVHNVVVSLEAIGPVPAGAATRGGEPSSVTISARPGPLAFVMEVMGGTGGGVVIDVDIAARSSVRAWVVVLAGRVVSVIIVGWRVRRGVGTAEVLSRVGSLDVAVVLVGRPTTWAQVPLMRSAPFTRRWASFLPVAASICAVTTVSIGPTGG
jgi:hypothetical protein